MLRLSHLTISIALLCSPMASAKLSGDVSLPAPVESEIQTAESAAANLDDNVDASVQATVEEENLTQYDDSAARTHLICQLEKREGSRIKRKRCLTAAQWNHELEIRILRSHLIKLAGRAPAWRTP